MRLATEVAEVVKWMFGTFFRSFFPWRMAVDFLVPGGPTRMIYIFESTVKYSVSIQILRCAAPATVPSPIH
jgi:hypothetical protein